MSDPTKTLVLTGASRGIGHATVLRFSNEGWRIITCSRDEVPAACQRDPNWAKHITADLAVPQEVERFIAEANDLLGDDPLHALVNNAAVSPKTPFKERLGCLNGDVGQWRALSTSPPLPVMSSTLSPARPTRPPRRRYRP
jgi:NAD(P)-dependent dehydrogenase (short-subunit alcohol dehydrogenase family)